MSDIRDMRQAITTARGILSMSEALGSAIADHDVGMRKAVSDLYHQARKTLWLICSNESCKHDICTLCDRCDVDSEDNLYSPDWVIR